MIRSFFKSKLQQELNDVLAVWTVATLTFDIENI